MSLATIQVPDGQLAALRESLLATHHELDTDTPRADMDRLLAEVEAALQRGVPASLTASRLILWGALYDTLCRSAERLADECNEFWRRSDPRTLRTEIANLEAVLDLLEPLGPPPGEPGPGYSGVRRGGEVPG